MKREIYLVPYGGLANRVRAINATLELAKANDIPLTVIWFKNFELNAPFTSIFNMPLYDKLMVKEATFFDRFIYRSPRRHTLWLPFITAPILFDRCIYSSEFVKLRNEGKLEDIIKSSGKVLIESCYDFGNYAPSLSDNFVLVKDILSEVDNYIDKNFGSRNIGVHIRRTDNLLSIERSPLELFIDAMQKEVELYPKTKFYLATDDKATKKYLKDIFGDKILSIETDCNRNSEEGIKEAVKEMWLLSKTEKIYGSFYSSFSEIAAKISNIPLQILQIND
ncbi:MAG: hypothetical protein J6L02_05320 [Bacteroidales bacterium]|nr:hypothetical protein [Bacteroidales bacterium]